jgi:hypothetical protein
MRRSRYGTSVPGAGAVHHINPESVSAFHAPFPGDNVKDSVHCMLFIDGRTFAALEDVQTVRERLGPRDGSQAQAAAKKAGV